MRFRQEILFEPGRRSQYTTLHQPASNPNRVLRGMRYVVDCVAAATSTQRRRRRYRHRNRQETLLLTTTNDTTTATTIDTTLFMQYAVHNTRRRHMFACFNKKPNDLRHFGSMDLSSQHNPTRLNLQQKHVIYNTLAPWACQSNMTRHC